MAILAELLANCKAYIAINVITLTIYSITYGTLTY